ncbi:MAG: mechanosensitive ion channel family protein, partial [Synechococcaceae cyanobacterium]|nr:mechanosensitive ion channel family protein [Synechococcaceae cyanobacterium]
MGGLQVWIIAAFAVAGLLLAARMSRRRRLPRMPVPVPVLALLAWAVLRSFPLAALPEGYGVWVGLADDLLLAYAAIQLLLWGGLEVPAALGLWRPPPRLLLQLTTLAAAALATVVVVRTSTRMDLLGLVATSAVLTAVIGLGAQEALKDLIAGLELQVGDEFGVGDWLILQDGMQGVVVSITWRDTWLRSIDDALVVVPNSKITSEVILNKGTYGWSSDRFEVGLDYDYPPARARALLAEVARQHPLVLVEPPPKIRVKEFAESSITYEVQVWQQQASLRATLDLRSDLLEQIWYALRREGQSIPFPVRDIQPRRAHRAAAADLPTPEACSEALAQHHLLVDLTAEQLRTLVEGSRLMAYGPGEAVVSEGAEGSSMYLLLRGRVEVLKRVGEERTVRVRELGPGEVFGEMTLFL